MIDLYLGENAGACRHRTYIMFLALNRLGLPCRMNGSTSHAWPEIWNPTTGAWVQVNLGGCDDTDPDSCPPCERKNPRYGVRRDGVLLKCCPEGYHMEGEVCVPNDGEGDNAEPIDCEKCIPIPCPPDYYCHPVLDKCIPDCQTLFGPDYHYLVERDECVSCKDEGELMVYDPETNGCKCMDCPEGYSLNDDKYCVDDKGEVSVDAPKGYYFYRDVGQCIPREDCEKIQPGTVFNESNGVCECPVIHRRTAEGREIQIVQTWDKRLRRCVERFECPQGQEVVYDPILGDYKCRDIEDDDDTDKSDIARKRETEKKKKDVDEGEKGVDIDPDAPDRELEKWLDLEDGTESYEDDAEDEVGDWVKVMRKYLRLKGNDPEGRRYKKDFWDYPDLYGLYNWLKKDANTELISFTKPERGKYIIFISLNNERADEAEEHWALWRESLADDDGIREIGTDNELFGDDKPDGLDYPDGRAWALFHNTV